MNNAIWITIICAVENCAILAGCGYVVFGLGYSGWWFALAVACLSSPNFNPPSSTPEPEAATEPPPNPPAPTEPSAS